MRLAASVSAAVLMVVCFIAVQASGREKAADKRAARKFVVECRIVSEEPPTKDRLGRKISQPLDFKTPPVTAREGEKASIEDLGHETFAIARLPQGEISITVASGTKLEMFVTGVSKDRALLDITAELSSPQTTPARDGESVCLSFAKLRGIECVTLGQKVVFRASSTQRWRLEATVTAAKD